MRFGKTTANWNRLVEWLLSAPIGACAYQLVMRNGRLIRYTKVDSDRFMLSNRYD